MKAEQQEIQIKGSQRPLQHYHAGLLLYQDSLSHFHHCPYYPLIPKGEVQGSNAPSFSWHLHLCSGPGFPPCLSRDTLTHAQV